jgi:NTP pyrophosphatase (non-canonical NTP hydrolase)
MNQRAYDETDGGPGQPQYGWPDRWHAYRDMVRATWGSTPGHAMADPTQRGPHLGLALAGEAGEVVEMFKKAHRGNDACAGMNVERLLDELGDVLWAIVSIADWAGHSLDDVRILNQVKMRERHPHLVEDPR